MTDEPTSNFQTFSATFHRNHEILERRVAQRGSEERKRMHLYLLGDIDAGKTTFITLELFKDGQASAHGMEELEVKREAMRELGFVSGQYAEYQIPTSIDYEEKLKTDLGSGSSLFLYQEFMDGLGIPDSSSDHYTTLEIMKTEFGGDKINKVWSYAMEGEETLRGRAPEGLADAYVAAAKDGMARLLDLDASEQVVLYFVNMEHFLFATQHAIQRSFDQLRARFEMLFMVNPRLRPILVINRFDCLDRAVQRRRRFLDQVLDFLSVFLGTIFAAVMHDGAEKNQQRVNNIVSHLGRKIAEYEREHLDYENLSRMEDLMLHAPEIYQEIGRVVLYGFYYAFHRMGFKLPSSDYCFLSSLINNDHLQLQDFELIYKAVALQLPYVQRGYNLDRHFKKDVLRSMVFELLSGPQPRVTAQQVRDYYLKNVNRRPEFRARGFQSELASVNIVTIYRALGEMVEVGVLGKTDDRPSRYFRI